MVKFSFGSLICEILKLIYNLIQILLKFDLGHFNFTQIQFIQMIMMQRDAHYAYKQYIYAGEHWLIAPPSSLLEI